MADPSSEEDGLLREWAPLTGFLQQIPLKAQRGLFTHNLNLTCVDILPEFIAVGTSLGLVYWYNRKKGDLQRLRCENTGSPITCVKVISTVDYMVAAGNDQGIVTVFQIPKTPPDGLPESMKPKKNKQVERYSISGLHSSPVTAIEWSMNGMKLFSGDKNGLVVLTEIDFYMHLSKSVELLNEKYEIVQLSYSQQLLLISTLYRSIVCCHREDRWKVSQVGQKERKVLGRLGATFYLGSGHPQELVVYSSRPGLRVWLADKNGVVQQTLIYKDAVMKEHTHTPLINPASSHVRQSRGDHRFGPLLVFREHLVTYSSDVVYVLNPITITVVATVADLRGVLDVAVNKDEIFILEGERSLIRVAFTPENIASDQESHLAVGMKLDAASSSTEVLIHIVGSSEVQSMLADKMVSKKTVWDHVAAEMKRTGFDMGENGGGRCRQKWSKIVRNYHHFTRTRTFNMKAHYPLYYDSLEEILNRKKQVINNISGEEGKSVVNSFVSTERKRKQDDECSVDVDSQSPSSPKQICQTLDSSCVSLLDIPISSNSSEDDGSKVFKIPPGNCTLNSTIPDNNQAFKSVSKQSNSEEFILVYPEGSEYFTDSKFRHESEVPVGHFDSEEFIPVYPDVLEDFTNNSVPEHFIDHSYAEESVTEYHKQPSHSVSKVCRNAGNINPSLPDLLEGTNKSSLSKKTNVSTQGPATVIVSPVPNQPARPIPTAGEAMMSLIMRLSEDDRRRENATARRTEKRMHNLEILLERQTVRQQELLNKVLFTVKELD